MTVASGMQGMNLFVVLANQTYQEAELANKRLCQFFIDNPMPYENEKLAITISIGASASDGTKSMDELLKQADEQLYRHKKSSEVETH